MPPKEKTVRDLVTPADSAAVVDYLIDYFNRPDIPELYSEQQSCNTVCLYLDPIAQTLSSHEVLGNLKKVATRG